MTKTSKTIVFFGNERLATGVETTAPTLQALIKAGYNVAAVVSNYSPGQSRNSRSLEIEEVAKAHNIPVWLPVKPAEIIDDLKALNAEAGVLVAYGKIVPQSVIDVFPRGIINIHPSILPLHRGPTPLESVIMAGDNRTGVSIMALSKAMDAGLVYAQSEVDLRGTETKQALADHLLDIGGSMLLEVLPGILQGSIVGLPQDDSRATYDQLIRKEDGLMDFSKPAFVLAREVRAYLGWPKSQTDLGGKQVVVTEAHAIEGLLESKKAIKSGNELHIGTPDGILVIDKLKPAGKAEMTAQAFLAGYTL